MKKKREWLGSYYNAMYWINDDGQIYRQVWRYTSDFGDSYLVNEPIRYLELPVEIKNELEAQE